MQPKDDFPRAAPFFKRMSRRGRVASSFSAQIIIPIIPIFFLVPVPVPVLGPFFRFLFCFFFSLLNHIWFQKFNAAFCLVLMHYLNLLATKQIQNGDSCLADSNEKTNDENISWIVIIQINFVPLQP